MWGLPQSAAKSQPVPAQSYGLWAAASAAVDGPRIPSTSCAKQRAPLGPRSELFARHADPGECHAGLRRMLWYPTYSAPCALPSLTSVTMWFGSRLFRYAAVLWAQRGMVVQPGSPAQRGSLARLQARMVGSSLWGGGGHADCSAAHFTPIFEVGNLNRLD